MQHSPFHQPLPDTNINLAHQHTDHSPDQPYPYQELELAPFPNPTHSQQTPGPDSVPCPSLSPFPQKPGTYSTPSRYPPPPPLSTPRTNAEHR